MLITSHALVTGFLISQVFYLVLPYKLWCRAQEKPEQVIVVCAACAKQNRYSPDYSTDMSNKNSCINTACVHTLVAIHIYL